MTMIRKLLLVFMMGSLPFLYSCDKLKGDVGPDGAQGEQGLAGEKGEPGDPASAIQVVFDTASTDASGNYINGVGFETANPKIIENGVVLMYAKSGNAWFALPGPVFFENDASNYTFLYVLDGSDLIFQLLQLDATPKKRKFQALRLVIIPARIARLSAELDLKDYEAVRRAFDLPE